MNQDNTLPPFNEIKLFLLFMAVIPFLVMLIVTHIKAEEQKQVLVNTKQVTVVRKRPPSAMTIEKLRTYKGLGNISDEEAQNILNSFRAFSGLTYKMYQEEQSGNRIC